MAKATTAADGTASFSYAECLPDMHESSGGNFVVVAQHNGQMQLASAGEINRDEPWENKRITVVGDLILDRSLFNGGDVLHATAFVRGYDWKGADAPLPTWHPTWSHTSGQVAFASPWGQQVITQVDEFGMASAVFAVPTNATHGQYQITATTGSQLDAGEQVAVDSPKSSLYASITIADPRHPSSVLHASTNALVYRPQDGHIPLNISCQSYLGELIKGATVEISYTVGYSPAHVGEFPVVLKTGELTNLPFTLPPRIARHIPLGSELQITVTWLDATRDLLKKTITVPIELSDWQVDVYTNPPAPRIFAGFPFRATGRVTIPDTVHLEHPPQIHLDLVEVDGTGNRQQTSLGVTPVEETDPCGCEGCPSCHWRTSEYTFTHSVQLTMPAVSHYELSARVVDDRDQPLNATIRLGKNETEQALSVLMGWKQTFYELYLDDNAQYSIGDTAIVHWHNPLESVRVLVTWGNNGLSQRRRKFVTLPAGPVNFTIPVGEECHGGCEVQAYVLVGSQPDVKLPIEQPKSQLFDLGLPGAALLQPLHIPVTAVVATGIAAVEIHAPVTAYASENVTITFDVTDEQGQPAEAGEIAVYVVDEALLDLLPYELPDLSKGCGDHFQPFQSQQVGVTTSLTLLSSGAAVDLALKSKEWRIAHNPWSAGDGGADAGNWGVKACQGSLDITDNLWMNSHVTPITYGTSENAASTMLSASLTGGCGHGPPPPPGPPPAPAPVPSPGGGGGKKPGSSSSSGHHRKPTVRKAYLATAFYQPDVKVHQGKAIVRFQMPANLGTWRVTAVATMAKSGDSHQGVVRREYAQSESTFVSRLPVSLEPSMPLIGRVGEHFQGGCVVDVLQAGPIKVSITMLGDGAGFLELRSPKEQTVTVVPGRPLEVLWSFTVLSVGAAQIQFTAVPVDAHVNGDAFVYDLPLESLQQPVTLSTSFAMLANKSFTRWTEGFEFPPAIPHTGSVQVAAGVGHYSSQRVIQQSIDGSVQAALQRSLQYWPDVFDLVASLAPPPVANTYGQANTSSNVLMRLSLRLLATVYTDSAGLEQRPVQLMVYPTFAQLPTNIFVLRVRCLATKEFAYSAAVQAWATTTAVNAVSRWEAAVSQALRERRSVPAGQSYDSWQPTLSWWGELALARFGVGKAYTFDEEVTNSSVVDLKEHAHLCGTEQQAMIALVLLEENVTASDTALVKTLSAKWYGALRVQGETAYVAAPNGDSALGLTAQALVLHVFALTRPADPLVEKLANYVSAGPAITGDSNQRMYSFSRQDSVYVAFALAAFDRAVGSAKPHLAVFVARGDGSGLFNASFGSSTGAAAVHESYSYAELHADRLQFYAIGTGEASVALAADFIPAQVFSEPVFFGLFVQKSMMLVGLGGKLTPCDLSKPLQPGQVVQVTVSVTAEDDQVAGVMVYDPLPAALQAQDPLLKAQRQDHQQLQQQLGSDASSGDSNNGFAPWSWWPDDPWRWGFSQMEVFQDHVSCFSPSFSAGTSECVYTAEVVTSGETFLLPPSHAYVPTHPGTMGLSGTRKFSVAPRPPAQTEGA